jgi:hypothetical protein
MRNIGLVFASLVLVGLGCDSPPGAPAKPTWVDDVEPILRANCFHCHGSQKVDVLALRWDFFDPADQQLMGLNVDFGATAPAAAFAHVLLWVNTGAKPLGLIMPPPPATPLSDRQMQILAAWSKESPPARGMRNPNHPPTAEWLVKPTKILIADEDHEEVLGKMTCNGVDGPILHSGTFELPTGWQPPCIARMFDGQDLVTVNLP